MGRTVAAVLLLGTTALAARDSQVVRRDWETMSMAQRKQFTDAVNALKMNKGAIDDEPAPSYDDLVLQHREAYRTPCPWVEHGEEPNIYHRNGDQKGPAFLPWHRQQLMVLEKALQQVSGDPSLGVPYWNWLKDSSKSDPAEAPLWSADEGIGGTGRSSDFVVADGPFAHWPLKYADLGEEYLERNLGGALAKPGNAADFAAAFAETTYDEPPYSADSKRGIRNYLEGFHGFANDKRRGDAPPAEGAGGVHKIQLHAAAHAFVGKSMINSTSPNDPAFFMVHAFTDALWESWQAAQLRRFPDTTVYDHFEPHSGGPPHHNLHDEMVELGGVTAHDVLDYQQLPYRYDELPVPSKLLPAQANATRSAV